MDDRELLTKLREAESKNYAFNLLVRKYQQRVYWLARKMVIDHEDADDIVQEVFIKVWMKIDKFREEASLFTWLYRITTNECLTFLKKKQRRLFLPLVDVKKELNSLIDESPYIIGDDIQLKLQKAILQLPDKQRLVFNLRYFENMKFDEIAEITDTSTGSLKASYHHAVKKIEEYITSN